MDLIQLRQGVNVVVLQGLAVLAPFRGAVMPGSPGSDDETTTTQIDLLLEGDGVTIENGLLSVGRLLSEAKQTAGIPGAEYVYLEARAAAGGRVLRSLVLGGWVELLGGGADQRAGGSQGARITLTRANWWEGDEVPLYLQNLHGSGSGGLTVYNHLDAGHCNYAHLAAANAAGDLPSPVIVDFDGTGGTDLTGTLYTGQDWHTATTLNPVLEGESGLTGSGVTQTRVTDGTFSGTGYARSAWSGTSEVTLWSASAAPAALRAFGGRAFLPLLKLANPLYAADLAGLWHYWRLVIEGIGPETVLKNTACYPAGPVLLPAAAMALPPWPVDLAGGDSPGLGFELQAQHAAAGAHQVDIDCLFLLPLDGWRIYRNTMISWGTSLQLRDDPYRNVIQAGTWRVQAHVYEGPGLWVMPGRDNRYYFLFDRAGGGFLPGAYGTVKLSHRPRRRVL